MFSFQTCDLAIKSKNLKIKYLFQFSNSKSFFQNFIKYHDYGYSYQDGTLPMLKKKIEKCVNTTTNPSWKKPNDVINKVETRSQLKKRDLLMQNTSKDIPNK